jgi:hypothetical protein
MDADVKFTATSMGNFVRPGTGRVPPKHACHDCKELFAPHLLTRMSTDSHVWRCPRCQEKHLDREANRTDLISEYHRAYYAMHKERKLAAKRKQYQERTQCVH